MKKIYKPILLSLFIIFLLPSLGFSERGIKIKTRRLALVIGNGAYKKAPLRNPVNDAYDMAAALEKIGFEVIHKENASQMSMENAIRDFGKRLRKGGVGLFYFAGHGIQVAGINYLIPVDARIESESDVKYECVDAGRVLGKMEDAENDLNIVVLDACRDNPFARSFRSSSSGLAHMDAPKGSLIAYATAPGSVAADGIGRNGVYTKHLLEHMKIPGLTVEQALKRTRIEVMNETEDKQVPWESSSLRGNFYFVPEGETTATKIPSKKDSTELEKEKKRLRQERLELKRLKAEIEREKLEAERKRLEAEKKRLEMDNLPLESKHTPPVSKPEEIGSDGSFIAYNTGVVKDTRTGLEWVAGPDIETTWDESNAWVANLTVAGRGWRMPTREELKTLYQKGAGTRNMTSLLKTTGWWVWSGETKASSSAWYFSFSYGYEYWRTCSYSDWDVRAFAVRSRNDGYEVAKLQPEQKYANPVSKPGEVGRDGTYIAYSNGVVKDTKTGLEWVAGPNRDTTWNEAMSWVKSLNIDGSGWRMPTMDELEGLYKEGAGSRNITPLLKTSGWGIWSGKTEASSYVWDFYFEYGDIRTWAYRDGSDKDRAFAVRFRR